MNSEKYEIEIKSLLGNSSNADKLRADLKAIDADSSCISSYTQLNHYFEGGDSRMLANRIGTHLVGDEYERMERIVNNGKNISVRTREMNGKVYIVMKASIGDDSSSNGVARLEVEALIPNMTLDQLDAEVLAAGYKYQAKWSRTREEYKVKDITVCLDKNAGYGYLAEFEKVVNDASKAEEAKREIGLFMQQLGVVELAQDRLERMFAYYNEHWPEYYGTENIFTIE